MHQIMQHIDLEFFKYADVLSHEKLRAKRGGQPGSCWLLDRSAPSRTPSVLRLRVGDYRIRFHDLPVLLF
jgi:hypothetical protein